MFRRLPFGISTTPEFFQQEMLRILEGVHGQVCHMGNILVSRVNKEQHKSIREVLRQLTGAGATLNTEKCEFARTSIKFLGTFLNSDGISPEPNTVVAVMGMPASADVRELRSFLGVVNHLVKFLARMAQKRKA